jgi:hypothetical protein
MKYEKPEIVFLGSALEATRSGSCNKSITHADCVSGNRGTSTAYEADE